MKREPHVVLVGLSALEAAADAKMRELADHTGANVAHLQLGDPSLETELTRLADAGHEQVTLIGVSTGSRAPAASWLRRVAGHWLRGREGFRPVVAVATGLIRADLSPASLARALEVTRPVHGREAPLASVAWEQVPGHHHHVLVCRGPRCSARGAEATAETIATALGRRGLGDDDVLLTQTGCLFPCNHAPVVCIHPADAWYARIDAAAAAALVDSHLVAGRSLEAHRLPRKPIPQEKP